MTDLEIELAQSSYRLRMAAQALKGDYPSLATYLNEQADRNRDLLKPIKVPQ